jgi:hypothetical protein
VRPSAGANLATDDALDGIDDPKGESCSRTAARRQRTSEIAAVQAVAAQSHLLALAGQPEAQTIVMVAKCLGSREERVHVEPFDYF